MSIAGNAIRAKEISIRSYSSATKPVRATAATPSTPEATFNVTSSFELGSKETAFDYNGYLGNELKRKDPTSLIVISITSIVWLMNSQKLIVLRRGQSHCLVLQ